MTRPQLSAPGSTSSWQGSMAEAGGWPLWLPRVGMADFCSIEVLLTVALSAGAEISRGGARAILANMEAAGFFREPALGGVFLLRPEVEATMLAELERTERGIERLRQQLSAAGLAQPAGGIGAQLAKWALEEAVQNRLGLVESEPGFGGLQVWRPLRIGDPYRMVTWWTDEQAFRGYVRSEAHHASHARTPRGPDGPRPSGLDRYRRISD